MSAGFDIQSQNRIVAVTRTFASEALREHAIQTANAAAESLKGLVIQTDEQAQEVLSLLATVKSGGKELAEARKRILEPFEAAKKEVTNTFWPVERALTAALDAGKKALEAYQAEQRRRALAEQQRVQEEQRKRDAAAAEEAKSLDLPVPPPVVMTTRSGYTPPAKIATNDAQMGGTSTLKCEVGNPHELDPTWIQLDSVMAKAAFRRDMREEAEVLRAERTGRKIRYYGVDFWYDHGVSIQQPGRDSRSL